MRRSLKPRGHAPAIVRDAENGLRMARRICRRAKATTSAIPGADFQSVWRINPL
jgi:hypothetical protein